MSIEESDMKTNKKPSSSSTGRRLVIGLIVVALLGGGGYFAYFLMNKDNRPATQTVANDVSKDKTYEAESEGTVFPVPENVPSDAIKNYTLVVDTEEYKIRKDAGSNSYIVTLYAIINRPDQYDMYKEQLAEYKKKALEYLKNQGVDITKVEIVYEPSEATNL